MLAAVDWEKLLPDYILAGREAETKPPLPFVFLRVCEAWHTKTSTGSGKVRNALKAAAWEMSWEAHFSVFTRMLTPVCYQGLNSGP